MEAKFFPDHARSFHSTAPQNFACPICSLGGTRYNVSPSTNLLSHLNSIHPDLIGKSLLPNYPVVNPNIFSNEDDYDWPDPPEDWLQKNSASYVEETLKTPLDKECPICYCEFEKGEVAARLACLCLFHKNCIEQWFKKRKMQEYARYTITKKKICNVNTTLYRERF